ncbi:MAG: TrkA C-terminal domain-containing protein [Nitriliruptorales bacterium]|nr:TrkA C-terminal domain-containing protein [Nitriliruptorales bacterium]
MPGIGKRVEFFTEEGRRMGVVQHHAGRREVFVCQPGDPDTTDVAVNLSEDDAHSLVDALGVESLTQEAGERTYEVEGLVFDWLDVPPDSPAAGTSIGQQRIRTRSGASVVAVIRQPRAVPAPEPDFVIEAGDTLVVAGTADGVEKARELLRPA